MSTDQTAAKDCKQCEFPHGYYDHSYQSAMEQDSVMQSFACKLCPCKVLGADMSFADFQKLVKQQTGLEI